MNRPPTRRLIALLVGMGLALGGVAIRLGVLEVRQSGQLVALGSEQRMRDQSLPATRGAIEDRDGHVQRRGADLLVEIRAVPDEVLEDLPVAPPGGRKERLWSGALVEIKLTAAETDGRLAIVEVTEPPGAEAPLHVHHREDEGFWVLDGAGIVTGALGSPETTAQVHPAAFTTALIRETGEEAI